MNKTYRLTLTDANGTVVDAWTLESENTAQDADYTYPIRALAVSSLASDINTAIERDNKV